MPDSLPTRLVHQAAREIAQHRRVGHGGCTCGIRIRPTEFGEYRPAYEAHHAEVATAAVLEGLATYEGDGHMPPAHWSYYHRDELARLAAQVREGS